PEADLARPWAAVGRRVARVRQAGALVPPPAAGRPAALAPLRAAAGPPAVARPGARAARAARARRNNRLANWEPGMKNEELGIRN
ncbi:MAG: hypothetical protein ACYTFM_12940, partial [Planctomycetota bacterium]